MIIESTRDNGKMISNMAKHTNNSKTDVFFRESTSMVNPKESADISGPMDSFIRESGWLE